MMSGANGANFRFAKFLSPYGPKTQIPAVLGHLRDRTEAAYEGHGFVVSNIYEIIRGEPPPGRGQYWRRFVSESDGNYDVSLLNSPAPSELSEAEESLLREIFASHGGKTRWQLRDFSHTLPQWQER